jgi:Condensation domain
MKIQNLKLSKLTSEKRELVAKLLAKQQIGLGKKVELKQVERDLFPVSFVQAAKLKSAIEDPTSYNLVISFEIEGEIDLKILEESYNAIIDRHKILRVSFFKKDGTYFQRLKDKAHYQIIYHDLRDMQTEPRQHLFEFAERAANYVFDLENEILFSVMLLHISDDRYYLINNIHHLLTDTWSNLLLASEFMKIYKSILEEGKSTLEDPFVHYTDYAVWESDWLKSPEAEQQKVFWKNYLSGALPLSIKTDFPRPKRLENSRLLNEYLVVKTETATKFIEFCIANKATIYNGVCAVLFTLLYFYSKTNDICLGTYAVLRSRPETYSMIGYMVNDITFRASVTGDSTFIDFLSHVQQIQSSALYGREIPFEVVNNLLDSACDYPLSSLQRVLCLYSQTEETLTINKINSATGENHGIFSEIDDLPWKATLVELPKKEEFTNRDLILSFYSNGHDIRLKLHYNSSLFKPETIKKMITQLETLFALYYTHNSATIDQIVEQI